MRLAILANLIRLNINIIVNRSYRNATLSKIELVEFDTYLLFVIV